MTPRSPLALIPQLTLLTLLLCVPSRGAAQQGFEALSERATETDRDLGALAAPLLTSCEALVGRSRELCEERLGEAAAALRGGTFLVSVEAVGRVTVGPYETRAGGFRLEVPGLELVRPDGGVVSTRPRQGGAMPSHLLGAAFVRVPAEAARAWAAQNGLDRLQLRLLFRFGRPFEDPAAPRPAERRGVPLQVQAVQVYNTSTGAVLVDSSGPRQALPAAPDPLGGRRALWHRQRDREVLWRTPDADRVLFHVRSEPAEDEPGTAVTLLATHRADTQELARFLTTDRQAAVDLTPHGEQSLLLIVTESRSRRGQVGRGQVLLLRWDPARAQMRVAARWAGANDEQPPAWVTDPTASPPSN